MIISADNVFESYSRMVAFGCPVASLLKDPKDVLHVPATELPFWDAYITMHGLNFLKDNLFYPDLMCGAGECESTLDNNYWYVRILTSAGKVVTARYSYPIDAVSHAIEKAYACYDTPKEEGWWLRVDQPLGFSSIEETPYYVMTIKDNGTWVAKTSRHTNHSVPISVLCGPTVNWNKLLVKNF